MLRIDVLNVVSYYISLVLNDPRHSIYLIICYRPTPAKMLKDHAWW